MAIWGFVRVGLLAYVRLVAEMGCTGDIHKRRNGALFIVFMYPLLFVRARAVALLHFLHSRIPAKRKRVRTLPLAIPMQTQYALFFGNLKHTHTQNTKQCHAVRIQNIAEV